MAKRLLVALASTPAALIGCHSSDDGLPSDPPTSVTEVASGGFQSPTDAVASPDGRTFYFTAWDMDQEPALFQVDAAPGSTAKALATGDPLDAPIGLVMSCDGATVYIADMGGEDGALLAASTSSGDVTELGSTGVSRPSGLAMAPDCKSLFASGRLADGTPALFEVPIGGGEARVVYQGAPLVSPTGLHVDDKRVVWALDHHALGASGEGVLFAVSADGGEATEVMSNLQLGTPGGCSLTAGGGVAVIPTRDADGNAQLTSVDIATGEVTQLATPDVAEPAGVRSARKAGVFALVDSAAGKIFSAR
jgi:DNA-binding beta-propeller fold protein YncE